MKVSAPCVAHVLHEVVGVGRCCHTESKELDDIRVNASAQLWALSRNGLMPVRWWALMVACHRVLAMREGMAIWGLPAGL